MREPKAIAFAGDWHMNTNWACIAVAAAIDQGADTILHVGDYGYNFRLSFVDKVEKACARDDLMIYFIDGNHDNHDILTALPLDEDGFGVLSAHVRYVPRGKRWTWWGQKFLGLGGAHSVDRRDRTPMLEWWPTEWITQSQHAKAQEGGPVDVMVCHDCPIGVNIPGITRRNGLQFFPEAELEAADEHRILLRDTVDVVRPKLLVHGHYHQFYTETVDDTRYVGLDMDGTENNLWIVRDVEDLYV